MRVPAWWIIATGWVSEKSFLIWGVLVMGALHGLLIASIIINFQMVTLTFDFFSNKDTLVYGERNRLRYAHSFDQSTNDFTLH